jgi:hypothetical protein
LCSQIDLDQEVRKAAKRLDPGKQAAGAGPKPETQQSGTLRPADETAVQPAPPEDDAAGDSEQELTIEGVFGVSEDKS